MSPFRRSLSFPGNLCWRKFINEFIYRMSRTGSHALSLGCVPTAFPFLLRGCFCKQAKCPCKACNRRANIFTTPGGSPRIKSGEVKTDLLMKMKITPASERDRNWCVCHLRATSPCDAFVCPQALPLQSSGKDGAHLVWNLTTADTRDPLSP